MRDISKQRWKFLGLAALMLALLAPLPGARAEEALHIGWLRGPNDLTLAKAHASIEKALAPEGIRVVWDGPFPAAAPAFQALNAGSIDITAGSSASVVAGLAANIPLVVFAYQKMSPSAEGIVVRNGAPIASLADLQGKSVAVNRGGTGEYLLSRALEVNHIDPAKVTRVYLDPADSGPGFLQGHVDAWATWDPFLALARSAYDGHVLADGGVIGSDNAVVLVASRHLTQERATLLRHVFSVIRAENSWAQAHPAEAGAIWATEMNIPASLAAEIGANNAVPTHAVTSADVAQIGRIADWYLAARIIPAKPDIAAGVVKLEDTP